MTKKDYELLAETVRTLSINSLHVYDLCNGDSEKIIALEKNIRETVAYGLSQKVGSDNPRFEVNSFLSACGVKV